MQNSKLNDHAKLNLPTARVNDFSKVIVHELVMNYCMSELNQWITDLCSNLVTEI